jgi:microcystin-dependent protein
MANPFVGEIRMFGGNFAPQGWMTCDGQLLPISQNTALFALVGTTYGGDGVSTFALPDLRGRLPIHQGNGYIQGQNGGVETATLTLNQIPNHTHTLTGSTDAAASRSLTGNVPANSTRPVYGTNATTTFAPSALTTAGGSQPHDNNQPYLCVTFIIALDGVFPSQN